MFRNSSRLAAAAISGFLAIAPALAEEARVTVDFSRSHGAFAHPEKYNKFGRARNNPNLRDADVASFNANGLHGTVYRAWVDAERINPVGTDTYDYIELYDYFDDLSRLSENLLVVLDTRVSVRNHNHILMW